MGEAHNVFIPHRHEDDRLVGELKAALESRGVVVRDSSVTADKPNAAHNEEYIKSQILAPGIRNAGKIVVTITPDTKNHWWVDWEIQHAARYPEKKIIGVWAPGADYCDIPVELEKHGHDIVPWNLDKIIDSLDGDTHWQQPDGTPRPAPALIRIAC